MVTVAPITQAEPDRPELAVELPKATKARLGLDEDRSWIFAADLNRFIWPGVDLRPTKRGSQRFDYGLLPANLYREVRDQVLALAKAGRAALTKRAE